MDSFEFNKIFMAVLIALLIGVASGIIADHLIAPKPLAKNVYVIEGAEDQGAVVQEVSNEKAEPIEPLLAQANIEEGKKLAVKCLQCHTFSKGEAQKVGPNLWGVVGGHHGHAQGYSYSEAIQKTLDKTWTFEALNEFLFNPRQYLPGTKMTFVGLKKAQDRANLIAYLRTLSDSPLSLPTK